MLYKLQVLFVCAVSLLAAGLCQAQAGTDQQAEFAAHARKAQGYLHENRPDLAIPELEAATTIDPENVEIEANLGVLLFFRAVQPRQFRTCASPSPSNLRWPRSRASWALPNCMPGAWRRGARIWPPRFHRSRM